MNANPEDIKTVDEYIQAFPKEVRVILERIRQTIREAAPEAVEMISYKMPTFKLKGRLLLSFAAWKDHIGFYPMPSGSEALKKELSPYKGAKSSVRFPLGKPIPYDLVRKIVNSRMGEKKP